jgi:molybdopterin-guanine dinucleotide biosynthesis protein A
LGAKNAITGMILAGGKSIRMGQDKAFIEVNGVPIILRVLAVLDRLFHETIIVANQKEPYTGLNIPVYRDLTPGQGALGGLYTGLVHSTFPYSFCVACDMPFLNRALIEYLLTRIEQYDAVVPRTSDGLQPLHAIYSKKCLEPIRHLLDLEKTKIMDFYPLIKVGILDEKEFLPLDPEKRSFTNVNTPEELQMLQKERERSLR